MPAVTVDDILTLPRLTDPDPAATTDRPVVSVTTAPQGFEGEGFPVRRAFAGVGTAALDPFIHMDQMGEVEYAPGEPKGTPWHPHRGFETVTYMIDGTFEHQDSTGGGGLITNGDTQWMTAGAGILHIERPPEDLVVSGGLFHGIQLWVNLPRSDKMIAPRYQDIRGDNVKLLSSPDGGALVRLIAGDLDGHAGPGATHTPITMLHATLAPGAQLRLPWRADFNALAYVLSGQGRVGAAGRPVHAGQLTVFGPPRAQRPGAEGAKSGETASFDISGAPAPEEADVSVPRASTDVVTLAADTTGESRTPELDVLVLGGQPIREPVAQYGPFVMNTRAELAQAFEDFQRGAMGHLPE